MMRINKLQILVDKLEVQLKHEKVENKANSIQIKKIQAYIISLGNEKDNTQAIRRMLEEKDNALQVLKKKLNIPSIEDVQSSELLALQEEKYKVHQETMEHKGRAVKLQEEKDRWETERSELISQITMLKKDQNDEKDTMEELMSQTHFDEDLSIVNIEKRLNDFSADDLLVPMSSVSLKDEEIKELKVENEKIKSELAKVSENKNKYCKTEINYKKNSMN